MRYLSVFSGIEAASVAWEPLGWEPVAFSEVDDFPSDVLAERFPDVPNLGDITKVDWSVYRGAVDLVVGGSPCQSFSIAGSRTGLDGASGLMWEYVRCVREVRPRWFVWENVPGALSSAKGEDFRCLLASMDELGYGLAWSVLDAQFAGVPQRRRRVFLVGSLGDRCSADVLFEPESLRWDLESSREKREALASDAERGTRAAGFAWHLGAKTRNIGYEVEQCPTVTSVKPPAACYTMQVRCGKPGGGKGALVQTDMSATLSTSNIQTLFQPVAMAANQRGELRYDGGDGQTVGAIPAHPSGKQIQAICMGSTRPRATVYSDFAPTLTAAAGQMDNNMPVVCMTDTQPHTSVEEDVCGTLSAHTHKDPPVVSGPDYVVRKLTPLECERLQGFPTVVDLKVEDMTSDELIICALINGDIFCNFSSGEVFGTRGPGGIKLSEPRKLGFVHPSGYVHINLSSSGVKKQVRAHRVIYIAAHGKIPEGMVIDHINNIKADNRLENLQAVTSEDNSKKAARDGLYLSGAENPSCKVSAEIRARIFHEYSSGGTTYRKLAKKYGISKSRVCQIVKEDGWTNVPFRGKKAPDGRRYKALGNSMAVPVMRWIGERIEGVENVHS